MKRQYISVALISVAIAAGAAIVADPEPSHPVQNAADIQELDNRVEIPTAMVPPEPEWVLAPVSVPARPILVPVPVSIPVPVAVSLFQPWAKTKLVERLSRHYTPLLKNAVLSHEKAMDGQLNLSRVLRHLSVEEPDWPTTRNRYLHQQIADLFRETLSWSDLPPGSPLSQVVEDQNNFGYKVLQVLAELDRRAALGDQSSRVSAEKFREVGRAFIDMKEEYVGRVAGAGLAAAVLSHDSCRKLSVASYYHDGDLQAVVPFSCGPWGPSLIRVDGEFSSTRRAAKTLRDYTDGEIDLPVVPYLNAPAWLDMSENPGYFVRRAVWLHWHDKVDGNVFRFSP